MTLHSWFAAASVWIWPRLVTHLWQATLFFLIALLVGALLKKGPARLRYSVWLLSLARLAVPSLLFVWLEQHAGLGLSYLRRVPVNMSHPVVQVLPMVSRAMAPLSFQPDTPASHLELLARHNELCCVATLIWLGGLVVLVCWQVQRSLTSWRAVKTGVRLDVGREIDTLDRVRATLSVERRIGLILAPAVSVPGVWGFWRPVVVLPSRLAKDLNDNELESLMMHEVIHVKRWDNLASLFQAALSSLLWFYPVVWIIDKRLLDEREQACDEEVLQHKESNAYVSSILRVVRFCLDLKIAGVSSVMGSNLKRRIENIMSHPRRRNLTFWHVVSLSLFGVALALSCVVAASHGNRVITAQSQKVGAILSGTIYDASRAAIPEAMVIISSLDGKSKEIAFANEAGDYEFGSLPEGAYTVEASKPGFRLFQQKGVAIKPGVPQRLDLTLEIGEVNQYFEVVGKSARVAPDISRKPRRIRVGGNVQEAKLVYQGQLDYPEEARQAGIQGTVLLEAIIGKDGTVVNYRVVNTLAHPFLLKAAAEAVKQWRYEPTLLNGEPVEVVTTVTVNFRLSEP